MTYNSATCFLLLAAAQVFLVSQNQCSAPMMARAIPSPPYCLSCRVEVIFHINPENDQEEHVRDQLNKGVVPWCPWHLQRIVTAWVYVGTLRVHVMLVQICCLSNMEIVFSEAWWVGTGYAACPFVFFCFQFSRVLPSMKQLEAELEREITEPRSPKFAYDDDASKDLDHKDENNTQTMSGTPVR
ncbi:hypothetical protein SORBI_3001G159032 [Sorghum bicolor]|uniref:Uncharacterized protein n=1 Tax=Sorghum bicolor TaxID=4558 RepID=A0A1Z5S6B1_SORBI|nr:hypothetical protein SORBI_3001G159032 [Sorghum bicolor]